MNDTNAKAKLYFKLLQVQKSLEPLEKSGRNDFHKYSYTTAGDVLLPVQRACNAHGLIIMANVIDSKIEPGRAWVTVQVTVADSETGESISVSAPGYAEDIKGDKSCYQSITGATKYAVRSFFCLPSEDDPERMPNRPAVSHGKSTPALIDQTTVELRRLGWSNDQGRLYLQDNFGKSARQNLTVQELQQFLTHLRSLPTAAAKPVPQLT